LVDESEPHLPSGHHFVDIFSCGPFRGGATVPSACDIPKLAAGAFYPNLISALGSEELVDPIYLPFGSRWFATTFDPSTRKTGERAQMGIGGVCRASNRTRELIRAPPISVALRLN